MKKKFCKCKCSSRKDRGMHYTLKEAERDLTEKYGKKPSQDEIDRYYNYMNSN